MAVNTDISCVIPRPDIASLSEEVRTELSKRLLGGAPVLPLSTEDILAFVMAGTVNLMWGFVTQALKQNDPETMCCDLLVTYAARRGVNLLGATRAKGYVAITGDAGAPIPANIRFVGESSRAYKLDPAVTYNPVALDANGGAVLRVVAITQGSIFNLNAGQTLTVGTTITGVDATATIVGNGLTGGTDEESCDALRRRVIASESSDVLVLNEAWYIRETLKYPGVTRACTDQCQGCCDPQNMIIYPFMHGVYGTQTTPDYGVPPCDVIDQMTDWMFGVEPGRGQGIAPIGIRGRYQAAVPVVIDVTAKCFAGCPIGAEDRIKAALWDYLSNTLCVGSTVCKDQLRAIIYRALGPDPCMSNIQFTFNQGIRYEDDSNVYLDCGFFLVLGTITLTPGYQ